ARPRSIQTERANSAAADTQYSASARLQRIGLGPNRRERLGTERSPGADLLGWLSRKLRSRRALCAIRCVRSDGTGLAGSAWKGETVLGAFARVPVSSRHRR